MAGKQDTIIRLTLLSARSTRNTRIMMVTSQDGTDMWERLVENVLQLPDRGLFSIDQKTKTIRFSNASEVSVLGMLEQL